MMPINLEKYVRNFDTKNKEVKFLILIIEYCLKIIIEYYNHYSLFFGKVSISKFLYFFHRISIFLYFFTIDFQP